MGLAIDLRQEDWSPASDDVLANLMIFMADEEGLLAYPELKAATLPANDNWPLQPPKSQAGEWLRALWRPEFRTVD
jgi:hypothetical protein